jgi:lysine decarboxylase/arginine decarboxylase
MKNLNKSSWPVLWVSDQLDAKNDQGRWTSLVIDKLAGDLGCSVIPSYTYGDAHEIIFSREDLGAVIIDRDLQDMGEVQFKAKESLKVYSNYMTRLKAKNSASPPKVDLPINVGALIYILRKRNGTIPILLLSGRGSIEDVTDYTLSKINGLIWKLTDTTEFLAGRIEQHVISYINDVMPPFFREMVRYVNEYKYAWHTPGHMGGQGFLTSPSGTAFHKFFGEDVLRADVSISVPELGSLLDHSGVTGDAETFSAKVFGADRTYYVLNGTSTANQIIWRSQVNPLEKTLVDRNCHKSLNYSMVITDAKPDYMHPMRNGLGIIGPVDFSKIEKTKTGSYKMGALTNSTYDGICYNTRYVAEALGNVECIHYDEAWFAYARFHPLYKDHYGMASPKEMGKLVFCTHSTHKLLTAFSQASMIHVRFQEQEDTSLDPTERKKNEEIRKEKHKLFHNSFNESYMMHSSTSPQYNMVASLEVASKMMHDNGEVAWGDILEEAVQLRKKVSAIYLDAVANGDWFFDMWQPAEVASLDIKYLLHKPDSQKHWILKPGEKWHGFDDLKEEYVMLDPIKLTFICPGMTANGKSSDKGIPAAIVTNYLLHRGIVCEKSDYYSFLLLNSLGTTRGKQGTLLAELFKFKSLYDNNAPLKEVFPNLVVAHPKDYDGKGLQDHCDDLHKYLKDNVILSLMDDAFKEIPPRDKTPSEAYRKVVKGQIGLTKLDDINVVKEHIERTRPDDMQQGEKTCHAAVMIVPYPPGIPIMMGGEEFEEHSHILAYLKARQDFENKFPGYESEIHGIERTAPDAENKKYFQTFLIKTNGVGSSQLS